MAKFTDGPAGGFGVLLRRAPLYLRAVLTPAAWDGLDQLADEPRAGEEVVAYRRTTAKQSIHVCTRGSRSPLGGWYQEADYAVVEPQPDAGSLWSTEGWRAWCLAQAAPVNPLPSWPGGRADP